MFIDLVLGFLLSFFIGLALYALVVGFFVLPVHLIYFLVPGLWDSRREFSKEFPGHYWGSLVVSLVVWYVILETFL